MLVLCFFLIVKTFKTSYCTPYFNFFTLLIPSKWKLFLLKPFGDLTFSSTQGKYMCSGEVAGKDCKKKTSNDQTNQTKILPISLLNLSWSWKIKKEINSPLQTSGRCWWRTTRGAAGWWELRPCPSCPWRSGRSNSPGPSVPLTWKTTATKSLFIFLSFTHIILSQGEKVTRQLWSEALSAALPTWSIYLN